MASEKEKAEFVKEATEMMGFKIIVDDILGNIETCRDELETLVTENVTDDFIKGKISGMRWMLRLPETYKKILEK